MTTHRLPTEQLVMEHFEAASPIMVALLPEFDPFLVKRLAMVLCASAHNVAQGAAPLRLDLVNADLPDVQLDDLGRLVRAFHDKVPEFASALRAQSGEPVTAFPSVSAPSPKAASPRHGRVGACRPTSERIGSQKKPSA